MLTAVQKCLRLVSDYSQQPLVMQNIPAEDPKVYDMMCEADTIGVFQIESRAQMSMLPRLRPRNYYDLVIQIAIVLKITNHFWICFDYNMIVFIFKHLICCD